MEQDKMLIATDAFLQNCNFELISPEEIEKLIYDDSDVLEYKKDVLIELLPWDIGKKYFRIGYVSKVERGEINYSHIDNIKDIAQLALDYLAIAWEASQLEKRVNISGSISKLSVLMRVLSRGDIAEILEDETLLSNYGKPALIKISEMLEIRNDLT